MIVLNSLQQALNDGMPVIPSELDAGYKMFYDEPFLGGRRFSFAKIVDGEAHTLSIFGLESPIDGVIYYNVGYAVKESLRGKGLAIEAVNTGIEKLKNELGREQVDKFYVEAVINITNHHSINVAKKLFLNDGIAMKEGTTETPALYFRKLITIR